MIFKIKRKLLLVLHQIFKILPMQENVIVFSSFLGKHYSDSPKYIYEYMIENDYKYKYIWLVNTPLYDRLEVENENIKKIKNFSPQYFYYMATAKYFVDNSRNHVFRKRKNQVVLQTWHGTPLKKLVYDVETITLPGTTTEKYYKNFSRSVSYWDYLVSPNQYSTEIFKKAFRYDGEFINSGYPRNDRLINYKPTEIIQLKEKLNIPLNKKVVLYALTFRDNKFEQGKKHTQEIILDFDVLQKKHPECVFILRLHYLIRIVTSANNIIDLSKHSDINDLYLISDMLITDYSSVFFDFAILKKPIVFFAYDLKEYEEELRGFYLNYQKDLPGKVIYNQGELERILKDTNKYEQQYINKYVEFNKKFNAWEDGNATKRVVERVFKKSKEE